MQESELYDEHRDSRLAGRYINLNHLRPILDDLAHRVQIDTIGISVNGVMIPSIELGSGNTRVLMWSQMHGNESTSTKAIFDLINVLLYSRTDYLNHFKIVIIPILNPDGAMIYDRFNAKGIDLNRDAQDLSQPESRSLRMVFDSFKPHYCFNLHGQRTIYGVGDTKLPATMSFLSPAADVEKSLTPARKKAMQLIVAVNKELQSLIPGQIGIYNDTHNINCVGDTFQKLGTPTVLFEAGHFGLDYRREMVRKYMFLSLYWMLESIRNDSYSYQAYRDYYKIPQNKESYWDLIIRSAYFASTNAVMDIGIKYQEKLNGEQLAFIPEIVEISSAIARHGHREFNANNNRVSGAGAKIKLGYSNDIVLINNEIFSLKCPES